MLNRHVAAAREAASPWDAPRAARVLERAIEARRRSNRRATVPWVLALAAASLTALVVRVASGGGGAIFDEPPADDRPAAIGIPSDALDAGKQTG
jgi:ferric-dicitrate binding protein FerR (iron transport regulator)